MTPTRDVQEMARIIARTHAETLHRFYIRAAQAIADAGYTKQGALDLTEDEVVA